MRLAGLDIGTSGCKITVLEQNGMVSGRFYQDYPVSRTSSEHEIDAAQIWLAVVDILTKAAAEYKDIAGIGVTSFGETFVLLDENDRPVCNSMLYTDPRGEEECQHLSDIIGKENISRITGLNPHSMYSLPKLMWLKNNKPELYKKTSKILLIGDYIVYMLTRKTQIDYSLASRTMAFDINNLEWSKDMMNAAGIDVSLFSKPVAIGTNAGTIPRDLAGKLGFTNDVLIASCGHDQVAAAVGCGVFYGHTAVDGAGSVQCVTPVFSREYINDALVNGNYAVVPYIETGKYVCYAFSFTGGALLKWFTDKFTGGAYPEENIFMSEPTGILALPHFSGAATPYMDSGSKGAIVGLTLTHTQKDIFYALMEGVCYEMRLNIDCLNGAGIKFERLRAAGGGANSGVWMQMKADVLNMPVTALQSAEAGAVGSAMMTGVAVGLFDDLRSAAKIFVQEKETYYPRAEMHEKYNEIYERYKKLYSAVRPLM
ncbi:MAG: FGGY family carbohydrate kinase [Oscillospiraceae bacterium]|nr:FGGY family carbohydrate kinase [Oscillospiraceae bacterium]